MCKCKSDFYWMTAWWVLPVQERVRAVGGHVTCVLSHAGWGHRVLSAAILLHAGRQLVSQGELLYEHAQTKECVSKCEIHKVSRLGLQERKLNARQNEWFSLELLQVLRWADTFFAIERKRTEQTILVFTFKLHTCTRNSKWVMKRKKTELNLQVLLKFPVSPTRAFLIQQVMSYKSGCHLSMDCVRLSVNILDYFTASAQTGGLRRLTRRCGFIAHHLGYGRMVRSLLFITDFLWLIET